MSAWETRLTPDALDHSRFRAWRRDERAVNGSWTPKAGAPPNDGTNGSFVKNLIGTRGETGTSILLHVPLNLQSWEEDKGQGGYDLQYRIGVRAANKRRGLLVRPTDPLDGRFVAAHCPVDDEPLVRLLGWMNVWECRRPEWVDDPHDAGQPCWIVPEANLRLLSGLAMKIASEVTGWAIDASIYEGQKPR